MNAKETINHLRNMSDYMMKAANHPKFYNTEGSRYLEALSHQLYCDSKDLENISYCWGMPQLDELEAI